MQHVSDLHPKFALTPHHVEVWQTSNLLRLRLGDKKKKEEERRNHMMKIIVCPIPQGDYNYFAECTATPACKTKLDGCIVWNAHSTVLGEEARVICIVPVCYVKTGRYGKT